MSPASIAMMVFTLILVAIATSLIEIPLRSRFSLRICPVLFIVVAYVLSHQSQKLVGLFGISAIGTKLNDIFHSGDG